MTPRRWAALCGVVVFAWVTAVAWLLGCNFDRSAYTASWALVTPLLTAIAWGAAWTYFEGGQP